MTDRRAPNDDSTDEPSQRELNALEQEQLRRQIALEMENFEGGFEG